MEVNKEKIRYILQFFLDKRENASQVAEIVNVVHGADTVTDNYMQFWYLRFHSGIFDVKENVENIDKITEIIKVDRHINSRSITYERKIDHKTGLNNFTQN